MDVHLCKCYMLFLVWTDVLFWCLADEYVPVCGLLEDHQVMLSLSLMIAGMPKMQFVGWMVTTL